MKGVEYLGALAAFMSSVTWAFASARYAEASRTVGTVRVNLVRALFATGLWNVCLIASEGSWRVNVGAERAALLAGSILCSYALADSMFFIAATRLGTSTALAISTTYPIWSALYGMSFRGEPVSPPRVTGIVLCVAGVVLLVRLSRAEGVKDAARKSSLGALLALLASLLWAGNTVLLKQGAAGLEIAQANAVRFGFAAMVLIVHALLRRAPESARSVSLGKLARTLAPALIADCALGSVFYVYGLSHTDLAIGATLSSLSPLAALGLGALSGSERVSAGRATCVCMTVAGVAVLMSAGR